MLSLEGRENLPEEIRKDLFQSGWLPTDRTISSWKPTYSIRKYFEARTVLLDAFLENERNSERYSSYTKGYGEGGKLSRILKTPHSFELDGSAEREEKPPEYSLLELSTYSAILSSIEKWKTNNKEEQ
jgi:hypothetical protein